MNIDRIDKEILRIIQQDAALTTAEVAEQVGLTTTPCWRRIQRMQDSGIIIKKVTLLRPEKLNLMLTVFVNVKVAKHDSSWLKKFAEHTQAFEEVVEFYRLSGEFDYMLKVLVCDMQGYDHFYKRFISGIELSEVTSSFAMEKIKNQTAIPLNHL
ncbi:Lrp/AsnC family transcriptional regulator [Brumicola pallidula]|uniref:Glutamate uptake regulatory protein n=1 Tax=Brumicola pallidula DSM 14239 = ACAM 615 TaxID=1121922 RepID=K6ZNK4_9ALTE|nr:Lrp/AsnC family transcriptional regulator [Glaciecola pallidula]GAC30468.1 glutamate uptake regulatory protein [Glaciecola pallidula DSM 14239 = ACAM 615]